MAERVVESARSRRLGRLLRGTRNSEKGEDRMNMFCQKQMAAAVSGVLIALLISVTPSPAGVLVNMATETTQLLNYAQLLAQYIRQGEQLAQEIRQLQETVRNGKALPNQIFG